MKLAPGLIERFFNKECTAEEAEQVVHYLEKYPAEMDKYLDADEWNSLQPGDLLAEPLCNEVWTKIRNKQKKSALIIRLKKSLVAATVVAIIGIGYNYFFYAAKDQHPTTTLIKTISLAKPGHVIRSNTSKQIIKIVLPDSSLISLSPGAIIEYDVPFQNNKREISLTGEALFSVAKDKTKPFIVTAGALTTTALGTKFKISTGKNLTATIDVKLFSGKVVIRPVHAGLTGWVNDVYLLPGQQLRYNADKLMLTVGKIKTEAHTPKTILKIPKQPLIPVAGDGLHFEGAALPDVINQLSVYFNVKIEFNNTELKTMNFTGAINKKDSVGNVLKLIGEMNKLQILQKDDIYIVQKTLN